MLVKTHIVCTSMHTEKIKLFGEIIEIDGAQKSDKEQLNLYTILVAWPWRVQKSLLHFYSLKGMVSCAFVYVAVNTINCSFCETLKDV